MDTLPYALKPNSVRQIDSEFLTQIVEFENGAEQRFARRASPIATYRLSWNLLTNSELSALNSFFTSQGGAFKAWYIIDPRIGGGVQTRLRFKTDKLTVQKIKAGIANVEVDVKTC